MIICCVSACDTLGPRGIEQGRTNYNEAILRTNSEQFLLNIVRLRYQDPPYMLEISSISSRLEFSGGLTASSNTGDFQSEDGVGASVTYSEKPTIIYEPLRGKDFVRQLMTPIDLNTLGLLRQSGWEMDDILRVFANEINGVPNAATGADSSPDGVPEYRKFREVSAAMDALEDSGGLILGNKKNSDSLILRVKPRVRKTSEFADFVRLLNLDSDAESYEIKLGLRTGGRDIIVIETRPILSAMFFVGKGIQIPEEHIRVGRLHHNYGEDGLLFDWSQVLNGLISIKSSSSRPDNASVAVEYDDYWYYVSENDVDSRETLTMLQIVFMLQAGGKTSSGPVLTLPVN
jgi:hypothetical protein